MQAQYMLLRYTCCCTALSAALECLQHPTACAAQGSHAYVPSVAPAKLMAFAQDLLSSARKVCIQGRMQVYT